MEYRKQPVLMVFVLFFMMNGFLLTSFHLEKG